jgi:multisubunit Na+/H+ antiporter MnhG subunit
MTFDVVLALLAAGVSVIVTSAVGAFTSRDAVTRLHYVTPITSMGGPLIGLSLAVQDGWGLETAQILFIVFLLAISGPVLEAATGRMIAQREGLVRPESPE